jgi:PAS domain S-box-containing protein
MNHAEFQLRGIADPRLAPHAASALPAWLWSEDGTRILWANPVGAKLLGSANAAALARKIFGPADPHRRQAAQLAGNLPRNGAVRLQRLRGFGAPLGLLVTCACARIEFAEDGPAILVAAAEFAGRTLSLPERLQRLIEGIELPIAAFTGDGALVAMSDAARPLLSFRTLADAGLDPARLEALKGGSVDTAIAPAGLTLRRVGAGTEIGLIALIDAHAPPIQRTVSNYEQPAESGEAPAEFTLIDEFAASTSEETVEVALPEPALKPDPVASSTEGPMPDYEAAAQSGEAPAESASSEESQSQPHEPSPYVEAVADEPSPDDAAAAPRSGEQPAPEPRRHPLRFVWQMDSDGRFTLDSDEFARLIGPQSAAMVGRLWSDIAEAFGLDPEGRVQRALATRDTWSGITLNWPVDGGGQLAVELSGLPIYDRSQNFAGYRGFGVCRDLDALRRLAALRHLEAITSSKAAKTASKAAKTAPGTEPALPGAALSTNSVSPEPATAERSAQNDSDKPVSDTPAETPGNVVPFRPLGETKSPVLTPVENSAFHELARELSARLENDDDPTAATSPSDPGENIVEHPAARDTQQDGEQPGWLLEAAPPARGDSVRDRALLDLLPVGVLIYRLDRLAYANSAFLKRMGYASLHALEEAGGLDALYVEAGVSGASSTSDSGTPVTISVPQADGAPDTAIDARLYTISWDGDPALALIFSGAAGEEASAAAAVATTPTEPAPSPSAPPSPAGSSSPIASADGQATAEELGAILDTTADGIVMFDAEGKLNSCNRSAEALFGYQGDELVQHNLTELFAPESQRVVADYLESIKGEGVASLLDHGRDVLGRNRQGGIIPLSMTMGRTRHDGPNFFAMFRDLSEARKSESELRQARRVADRAAGAKADLLARISHEVRAPLNAIIGFAEVMIGERFGALGNERYVEYMKDIRASGERVITIINELLDLSRIEAGKLELTFANQNLNDLVEQCVSVMQPQANRERIIIRTSLGHVLPPVVADASALRQIAMNLITNSIHLANAGGQVIVSTALSDFGEVVLRVRDTGHGLNENEVAAAMEPFRTQPPSEQASATSGVSLSLTKALVEANRAQFHIKTGPHAGTLIEVVFSQEMTRA